MTYWEAVKISIWPALCSTADVLVYLWALYCLVEWACSWWNESDEDEEEEFDPLEEARCLSGTGEPRPIQTCTRDHECGVDGPCNGFPRRPISHTVEGFKRPYPGDYDPETDPSHYNIGALGSRDGERE